MMPDCDNIVQEALDASKHSLSIAASIFEEASKCYDQKGNRSKAGQYLTLAGDFFLDIGKQEKAAICYGKAVIRYLMADDLDTAYILLEKGKEYGFTSATHQYRIALDALDRKTKLKREESISKEKNGENDIRYLKSEDMESFPELDILPVEEDDSELLEINTDRFESENEVKAVKQDFIIQQLENGVKSQVRSLDVLAAVSKSTRNRMEQNVQSNAFVKNKSGDTRHITPNLTIIPSEHIRESNNVFTGINAVSETELVNHDLNKELNSNKVKSDIPEILEKSDNVKLEYAAKTELINEYEEELIDIEVVDTIPFQWQVIDVKTDFDLEEKQKTTEGLIFTWKKEKIDPGKRATVEYILRKRVERSIIIRRENKVSIVNFFHSIQHDLDAHLNFVNTTGKLLQDILIEDVIPPELVIQTVNTSQNIKPITIPTHDSTLYRWIFSNLQPGDNFEVYYSFREKPLTRYYQEEIETDTGNIIVKKISQPLIDSTQQEYIWLYSIENEISLEIILFDRIPYDFEILMVEPFHFRPSFLDEKTQRLLIWKIPAEEELNVIIIRIRGNNSFTPLAPQIKLKGMGKVELIERNSISEKRLIDLRRLRNTLKGTR